MSARGGLRQHRATLQAQWSRYVPQLAAGGVVAREFWPEGGTGPAAAPSAAVPRAEVADSWRRSLGTVDPGRDSAPDSDAGEIRARWTTSPLRRPVTELAGEMRSIADAGYIAAVTDESGTILWTCGGRVMRRRAERVNFAPGGCWDEPAMGTNALSLALHNGRPSTVFSAEHLVAALHSWTCYCAPIRDARGRTLGVLDLSTTWDRSHPLALTTVRTLVSSIEARLRTGEDNSRSPHGAVRLNCLGRESAHRDGIPLRLPPRQWEILVLLALEPDGRRPEQLRQALYGDRQVSASTFKAEVSHLRRALDGALSKGTYALTLPVDCDAVQVLHALRARDLSTALRLYRGPLLPHSEAPGIVEWRARIDVALRHAVLEDDSPEHALRYGELVPYDLQVHEHALRLLRPGDGRRGLAAGRLDAALRD
ncbi:transcriptional regulator [Streptomyces sp. NA04227]|uniref:helix-turn-helix domain-containing protein n=1 Tax=Streptomyces sp. NA04227 TaxID=2742136 RepID=UPI00159136BF|nr:helix-turn-helix domain-containing protein [Streptomyces sp. NA04227]QKW09999.1 transcriptional regulator [Streptomyces sp. NA04227]